MWRVVVSAAILMMSVISGKSQESDCAKLTVIECVQRISQIARDLNEKFDGVFQQIDRSELPVGTVITSTISPDVFLSPANPQFDPEKWIAADGRTLPAGSVYQKMTGQSAAPDLSKIAKQKVILDIASGAASHGQNIAQLRTPEFASDNWVMHFGLRDLHGNRANNDYEQDVDHFQVYDDGGGVRAVGRTLNWKHGAWGAWNGGSVNFLGLASTPSVFYYYVKIN